MSEYPKRGRERFKQYKMIILFFVFIIKVMPLGLRKTFFEWSRFFNGLFGIIIRYILLKSIAISCGDNVAVFQGVYILNPENIRIGNNVSIHPMCYIDAGGEINIGNDVSIAHNVTIMSSSHIYSDIDIPLKDQEVVFSTTNIEGDVWIGAKATITYGKNIGSGVVIGAGSVITKDCVSNGIYVGIPARRIKERIKDENCNSNFNIQ